MPRIVTLVEGTGDFDAVPGLIHRILHKQELWTWHVARPKKVKGLGALKKHLSKFMTYAERDVDEGGILILLDLDDGCPKTEALNLAQQIRNLNLSCPVVIVFAHREYEAWFLASLNTIAKQSDLLPTDLKHKGNVEGIRDVKGWLTRQMPPGRAYKETIQQKDFTNLMDLDIACQNSRSFRRLYSAIEELAEMSKNKYRGQVTPLQSTQD